MVDEGRLGFGDGGGGGGGGDGGGNEDGGSIIEGGGASGVLVGGIGLLGPVLKPLPPAIASNGSKNRSTWSRTGSCPHGFIQASMTEKTSSSVMPVASDISLNPSSVKSVSAAMGPTPGIAATPSVIPNVKVWNTTEHHTWTIKGSDKMTSFTSISPKTISHRHLPSVTLPVTSGETMNSFWHGPSG